MEGRWAKLTLCAHLNKYIDITKPSDPIIEELILRYTKVSEELKFCQVTPTLTPEDDLVYIKADWLMFQRDCILPKVQTTKSSNTEVNVSSDPSDLIAKWKLVNKQGDK